MKHPVNQLTPKNAVLLSAFFLFFAVLELAAYHKGGIFSIVAAHLWLAEAMLCLFFFCFAAGKTLLADIRSRRLFLPLFYLLLLALFCSKIGCLAYSDISFEATLQIAAGLDSFELPDFNYTGVAFLDYANRQYIINALPAVLFGRSIFTLHLGFALPFLLGMTLLFLELRAWLKLWGLKEEYALLPLFSLPVFPYITEYFMNFEQTLNPVSYTLLGLALLLRFYRKTDPAGVIALAFVGGMCCNSYTPVLAFFGFLLVFLFLWAIWLLYLKHRTFGLPFAPDTQVPPCFCSPFSPDRRLLLCFSLLFRLCCYFAATLVTRQKDMITTPKSNLSLLRSTVLSWFDFFTDRYALFFGIWLFPVLLYLLLSLTGRLKLPHFLTAVWMLLTVFFSGALAGYTTYEKAHEIQRNMLLIPVFATAFFFAAAAFFQKHPLHPPRFLLPLTLFLLLLLGQFNFSREHHSFTYYRYVQPLKYMFACTEELLPGLKLADTDEFNLVLLTDNSLLGNLSDYTAFFCPNAHSFTAAPGELPDGVDFSLPTLIFCESNNFPDDWMADIAEASFENTRYHTTVTWYYVTILPTP